MIASVGYDANMETLEVEFNTGKIYQYFEVPQAVYEELLAADSKGQYMNSAIIDCYPYTQIKQKRR